MAGTSEAIPVKSTIRVPVFDTEVFLYVGGTHGDFCACLKADFATEIEVEDGLAGQTVDVTMKDGRMRSAVWVEEKSLANVAHEMLHAAIAIMRYLDTPLTEDTEEIYCRLQEFLLTQAFDAR